MSTKEYGDCMKLLVIVSCCLPYAMAAPTEEEAPTKTGKGVPPIMQTLLTDIARELISRSTSNSQVLTLNFTNLLILLVLKGLLWGASYAGSTGYDKSRSEDTPPQQFITETEVLLLLSYLMGDDQKDFECLHRVACEDPDKATEYMNAGMIISNAAKYVGVASSGNEKYEKLLSQLQEAVQFKENGGNCETRYSCLHQQSENTV